MPQRPPPPGAKKNRARRPVKVLTRHQREQMTETMLAGATAAEAQAQVAPGTLDHMCVDCQRPVSLADPGHQYHQRVPRNSVRSDEGGPESVDVQQAAADEVVFRYATGVPGFDRVLNGGIPRQGVVLIDGEPGIGKSTLLVTVAGNLAAAGRNVLYVSGEETHAQVAALARRLQRAHAGFRVFYCDSMERLRRELRVLSIQGFHVDMLVTDSVQTMRTDLAPGGPGSVSQVRAVSEQLRVIAKAEGGPSVLITCHVTKDGEMAGPRTLEHACDIRCTFGKDSREGRFLRGVKNRFGPTGVISAFEMVGTGLREVKDPSFVSWTTLLGDPGVTGFVAAHMAQPVIVPVECAISEPSEDGVSAKGVFATGLSADRLRFLVEAMGQHCDVKFGKRSVRVRVPEVAGEMVSDPALDLAVVAALWSAHQRVVVPTLLYWGEVGLSGKVTAGPRADHRLNYAASVKGPLVGVMVGSRSGLASGAMKVHTINHMRDVVAALETLSSPLPARMAG